MGERNGDERTLGRLRVIGWSLAAALLLLPAIAMQFTDEVAWSASDFVFAAVLLGGTGLLAELVVRRSTDNAFRAGAAVALLATFLLAWSNAAVGFVGSGDNLANVLYAALVALPFLGGLLVGFRARGLVRVMAVTAIAQALITALAFAQGLVTEERPAAIVGINLFFLVLWTAAGTLFNKAAQHTAA
jgi:hypothetical protein